MPIPLILIPLRRPFEFSRSCLVHITWLARLGSAPQLFSTHCSTAALGQLFSFHTSQHLNFPTCLPYCCMYYRPDECHKICGFPTEHYILEKLCDSKSQNVFWKEPTYKRNKYPLWGDRIVTIQDEHKKVDFENITGKSNSTQLKIGAYVFIET